MPRTRALRHASSALIIGLGLLTLAVFALLPSASSGRSGEELLLAVILGALVSAAYRFPLPVTFGSAIVLDTSVVIAAVLLLDPRLAILATGLGTLAAHMLRPAGMDVGETLFNTFQTSLQAGVAAGILAAAGWTMTAADMWDTAFLPAFAAGIVAMYLINTGAVATVIGLESTLRPFDVWRTDRSRAEVVEWLSYVAFGLLLAFVSAASLWGIALLVVPAILVHQLLAQSLREHRHEMRQMILSLADSVESRDPATQGHGERVAELARAMAEELQLSPEQVRLTSAAARVHEIGKLAVDDAIVRKAGPLSMREMRAMHRAPSAAAELVARVPEFALTADLVRHHLERWDGAGYPDGLAGDAIPLGARIIAVADAVDTMAIERPFRARLSTEQIVDELQRQRGRQWDDRVVAALMAGLESERITLPAVDETDRSTVPPASRHDVATVVPRVRTRSRGNAIGIIFSIIGGLGIAYLLAERALNVVLRFSWHQEALAGVAALLALVGPALLLRGWLRMRRESHARIAQERELRHRVLHDLLTGLPNRALFLDRLEHALALARRYRQHTAVLFLDLDDFKRVNDAYGHPAGDRLLVAVAERLQGCLRVGDTAARHSGDEFTILLENVRDEQDAVQVAERVLEALSHPFVIAGETVRISSSIGVAVAGPDASDPDILIDAADSALYDAKHVGKARAAVYRPGPATIEERTGRFMTSLPHETPTGTDRVR